MTITIDDDEKRKGPPLPFPDNGKGREALSILLFGCESWCLTEALLHRINTGDGPYPMTAVIGDGILLKCGNKGSDEMEMDYHFNVPIAAFHNKYETHSFHLRPHLH